LKKNPITIYVVYRGRSSCVTSFIFQPLPWMKFVIYCNSSSRFKPLTHEIYSRVPLQGKLLVTAASQCTGKKSGGRKTDFIPTERWKLQISAIHLD